MINQINNAYKKAFYFNRFQLKKTTMRALWAVVSCQTISQTALIVNWNGARKSTTFELLKSK